jgi:hypothetical protein
MRLERFFKWAWMRREKTDTDRLDFIEQILDSVITRRENQLKNIRAGGETEAFCELSINELNGVLGLIDIVRDRTDLR